MKYMAKEIKLKVGGGTQRGEVSLSALLPHTVSLSVSYQGERASTVVLTGEQLLELRRALDEIASRGDLRGAEKLRLAA